MLSILNYKMLWEVILEMTNRKQPEGINKKEREGACWKRFPR